MVTLYVAPSCTSCRKARTWLKENEIPFVEHKLTSESLSLSELKEIFRLTENGTEDLISTKSKVYQKNITDIDQMRLKDLLSLIREKPGILRTPIIHDGKRLMTGYNEFQIRKFIPRSVRTINFQEARQAIQ
ncbi:transcriptional regulator Spx [Lentibacillus sediminis]|uniref:transcriptional regulator Spx n=1 Tax=Lentibacillus sediminis TaxID=1940529 RepID=UPI000C1C769E|nr:transcriptional regulator Spx [Lentibacillus sediminis]